MRSNDQQLISAPDLVLRSVGKTSLVELQNRSANGARFFAKCEFQNPSGSHKDRLYKHAIQVLEKNGVLRQGMTLVDFSSGNAGAALALIGAVKGYKVIVVRPAGLSRGKTAQILAYGGNVVFTPSHLGVPGARDRALKIARQLAGQGYLMHQTDSRMNPEAYYRCEREIVQSFRRLGLTIDAFVSGIGTGGTLTGVAHAIKEAYPAAKIVAVEMAESALLYRTRNGRHLRLRRHNIEGLSTGELYSVLDTTIINCIAICTQKEALAAQREIHKREKLFIGPSSGASLHAASRFATRLSPNSNIVTIFWDVAWKYISEMRLPRKVELRLTHEKLL